MDSVFGSENFSKKDAWKEEEVQSRSKTLY